MHHAAAACKRGGGDPQAPQHILPRPTRGDEPPVGGGATVGGVERERERLEWEPLIFQVQARDLGVLAVLWWRTSLQAATE